MRLGSSDSAVRGGWPASSTRVAGRTESLLTCTMYHCEPSASAPPGARYDDRPGFSSSTFWLLPKLIWGCCLSAARAGTKPANKAAQNSRRVASLVIKRRVFPNARSTWLRIFLEHGKEQMVGPLAVDQQITPRQAFLAKTGTRQQAFGCIVIGQTGGFDAVQAQCAENKGN